MGYTTNLTNLQWWSIKRFFDVGNYGNRRKHPIRELVNAVLYLLKTGCQWRMLPKDFPPYSTVHTFYRRCRTKGIWEKIKDYLVKKNEKKLAEIVSRATEYSIHKALKQQEKQKKLDMMVTKKLKAENVIFLRIFKAIC